MRGPLLSHWFGMNNHMTFKHTATSNTGRNQILDFGKLWTTSVNTSFPSGYMTTFDGGRNQNRYEGYMNKAVSLPFCLGGSWCVDPVTKIKVGVRRECSGLTGGEMQRPFMFGGDVGWLWADTPLNMGLDFLVEDDSTFVMRQLMPGSSATSMEYCASKVQWNFCVCEGCNCPAYSMADIQIDHKMINSTKEEQEGKKRNPAKIARCALWFQHADQAIRLYTSSVRGAIISLKMACCTPWKHKNSKQGKCNNGYVAGLAHGLPPWIKTHTTPPEGSVYATPGQAGKWARWGKDFNKKTIGTDAPEDIYGYSRGLDQKPGGIGYDPIRDCAGVICKNENLDPCVFEKKGCPKSRM